LVQFSEILAKNPGKSVIKMAFSYDFPKWEIMTKFRQLFTIFHIENLIKNPVFFQGFVNFFTHGKLGTSLRFSLNFPFWKTVKCLLWYIPLAVLSKSQLVHTIPRTQDSLASQLAS